MQQKEQDQNPKNKMVEEKQKTEEKKEVKEIVKTEKKPSEEKIENKESQKEEKPDDKDVKSEAKEEVKDEKKKETEKKPVQTKPKIKKTKAIVNSSNIPISTKHSKAVCKFIKGKKIENAINDLEKVIVQKKPVPMKGEIPHQKGIMSGRYPKKAAQHFIKLLKSLSANANLHEIENPIIKEAIANIGSRPYGKFGRVRRKRTHIKITAIKKIKEAKK